MLNVKKPIEMLHATLHSFFIKELMKRTRKILAAHEAQLREYKAQRSYWNQRIVRKNKLIREYKKTLELYESDL